MGQALTTAPTVEPVTLTECKLHCRVDTTDDDALITALIVAARQQAEHKTGRVLVTQTWDVTFDAFPGDSDDSIVLPFPPLQSVTSITYLDANGASQTLASTEYQVIINELTGRVILAYGKSWPSTLDHPNAITVRMVAGYGLAVSVPESIKSWIKLMVGAMYANREAETVASGSVLSLGFADRLLDAYKVWDRKCKPVS